MTQVPRGTFRVSYRDGRDLCQQQDRRWVFAVLIESGGAIINKVAERLSVTACPKVPHHDAETDGERVLAVY